MLRKVNYAFLYDFEKSTSLDYLKQKHFVVFDKSTYSDEKKMHFSRFLEMYERQPPYILISNLKLRRDAIKNFFPNINTT